MDGNSTRTFQRMGRRRFLTRLAALGVTGPALTGAAQEAVAEKGYDPDEEVLRVAGWVHTNHEKVKKGAFPERKPIFYTISRDKWVRVETADHAAHQLRKQLQQRFGRKSVSVGVQITKDSGRSRRGVVVEHVSVKHLDGSVAAPSTLFDEFAETVPARVSGTAGKGTKYETTVTDIPVRVKQVTEIPEGKADHYSSNYDQIPGGCYHETEPVAGRIFFGTVGTPAVKDSNGDPVLVTAGHNFDHNDDGTLDAVELHQPHYDSSDFDFVGFVDQANADPDLDWATVGFDSGHGIEWDMAADGGGYKHHEINGIRSRQYLNDNIGMNLKKQGSSTGTEVGSTQILGDTWVKIDDEAASEEGDSGGPYYDTTTEFVDGFEITAAKIAAIHRGTPEGENYRKGTLMESIENHAGVTI